MRFLSILLMALATTVVQAENIKVSRTSEMLIIENDLIQRSFSIVDRFAPISFFDKRTQF